MILSRRIQSPLLAAAIAAATATSSFAQAAPPAAISVSGEASVSVAPDLAQIDGGITTEARTAREASDANNRAMAAIMPALRAAGMADADIQTSRISLQPQSAPVRPNGPLQITGYRATNRVTVRIHDVARVAATIDALVAAGANDIGGIVFIMSQESKLLDDARVKAFEDARRKAEIYAKAANVRLGAPIRVSEDGSAGPVPLRASFRAGALAPVSPGEETLRVQVSVSYAIEPATP